MKDRENTDGLIDDKLLKGLKELTKQRRKTVKKGDNVLHLEFLGELSEEELKEIETKLSEAKLELSYHNKSGIPYALLEDYTLVTFFVIHQALMLDILKNIGMSAAWDAVKWSLLFGRDKLRGKKYNKLQGGKITEKEIKFGFNAQLDKHTSINFELNGNLDREVIEKAIDKTLSFIGEYKRNQAYKISDYVYYDEKKEQWIKVDVEKEIRKKAKKKNKVLEKILEEKRKQKKDNKKK